MHGEGCIKKLNKVPKVMWEERGCPDYKPFCPATLLLLLKILSLLVGGG